MGSAFIAYAMIMLLMMRVGAGFLMRRKVAQEYLDSWVRRDVPFLSCRRANLLAFLRSSWYLSPASSDP